MARSILVLGKSGTGKSTSLRNLPAQRTLLISPNAKPLPWQGSSNHYQIGKNLIKTSDMASVANYIRQAAESGNFDFVVVEDTTHYQNKRMMQNDFIASKDWGKWNRFGADVYNMMTKDLESYRDDLTIIFIAHTDTKEDGTVGLRTAGKLLDNTIDIPSYFTYTFHSKVLKNDNQLQYVFQTNDDGYTLAKTPMGMFKDMYIENDMAMIIQQIKDYETGSPSK